MSQAFDLGSLADVPGDGPWVITVDWNDGTTSQFAYGATGSITVLKHTYRHASAWLSPYQVQVTAMDTDKAISNMVQFPVTVSGAEPTVSPAARRRSPRGVRTA